MGCDAEKELILNSPGLNMSLSHHTPPQVAPLPVIMFLNMWQPLKGSSGRGPGQTLRSKLGPTTLLRRNID